LPTRVLRTSGAKPVSSSRITAPATKAVATKMPNTHMMASVCAMA
jgi:hypothetical protein